MVLRIHRHPDNDAGYCVALSLATSSSTAPRQIAHSRTSYGFLRLKFSQRLDFIGPPISGTHPLLRMRQVQEEFYDKTKSAAAAKRDTAKMELYDSNKENVSSTHDDSLHHQLTHDPDDSRREASELCQQKNRSPFAGVLE